MKTINNVIVNTAAGTATYTDVQNVSTSGDGALVLHLFDDAKKAKEVWFGPGFWHVMTADTEKING